MEIQFDKLMIYFCLFCSNEEEVKEQDQDEQENRQPLYQDLHDEYVNILIVLLNMFC
jgi:hypothetical protein